MSPDKIRALAADLRAASAEMDDEANAFDASGHWHPAHALIIDARWARETAGRLDAWAARRTAGGDPQ